MSQAMQQMKERLEVDEGKKKHPKACFVVYFNTIEQSYTYKYFAILGKIG